MPGCLKNQGFLTPCFPQTKVAQPPTSKTKISSVFGTSRPRSWRSRRWGFHVTHWYGIKGVLSADIFQFLSSRYASATYHVKHQVAYTGMPSIPNNKLAGTRLKSQCFPLTPLAMKIWILLSIDDFRLRVSRAWLHQPCGSLNGHIPCGTNWV